MKLLLILFFASTVNSFTQDPTIYSRFTYEQMTNIASTLRLSHRIFYKASTGPNAIWFDVVKKGDLKTIQQMVKTGQNIEVKDTGSLGQTALLWASFLGYLDIVQYLVLEGADLFATDRADVQHAFKSAILGGDLPTITYLYSLLKDKIDINAQDIGDGETPLMVAVDNNRVDAVNFLIKQGADVSIVSTQLNHNALSFACRRQNKIMQDILIKAGAINIRTKSTKCS